MNKKGLELKSAFFALIAISTIAMAIGIAINDWSSFYGSGVDSDLESFNKLNTISNTAENQRTRLQADDPNPGTDPEATTYRGVYGILTTMWGSLNLVYGEEGLIDSVGERFGIPSYFRQAIVAFMIIAITFAIIAIIFRLSRRSA